jgi:hypothetical protein
MNKVTDNNFQKLLDDLLQTQTFDEKILSELLKLVFERVSAKGSTDLFINVISYFSHRLKQLQEPTYKLLKKCVEARVLAYSLNPDQNALTWGKFVGNLIKEKIVKTKTIEKVLEDLQSQSEPKELLIEATCALLEVAGPYLNTLGQAALRKVFEWLGQLNAANFSKKVNFSIVNFVEQKEKILTPAFEYVPRFSEPVFKRSGKKVSFSGNCEFTPVISNKTKRILKHTLSEESKRELKACVSEYVKGKKDLSQLKGIFETCKNQERQLVYQIFKYSLIQFSRDFEFNMICELIFNTHEKFLSKCMIETGVAHTVEGIEDIKLDTPLAAMYLKGMIENLKEKGLIENPQYLFDHLNRPEEGKLSELPSEYTY